MRPPRRAMAAGDEGTSWVSDRYPQKHCELDERTLERRELLDQVVALVTVMLNAYERRQHAPQTVNGRRRAADDER